MRGRRRDPKRNRGSTFVEAKLKNVVEETRAHKRIGAQSSWKRCLNITEEMNTPKRTMV
jgi:hypothetical protein